MLETYFVAPKTLRRLRSGPSGPYIDGFATYLKNERYAHATAIQYLRAANHLGHFIASQGKTLREITPQSLNAFRRHLPSCYCPQSNGGHIEHHVLYGTRRFVTYLQTIGVFTHRHHQEEHEQEALLIVSFRQWLRRHRGVAESTLKLYGWGVNKLVQALGDDPSQYNVQRIRAFFLDYATRCGTSTAQRER